MPNFPIIDGPLPTPAGAPSVSKMAVLQAFYEATRDGRIGTPQERLAAKRRKAENERLMARVRTLDVHRLGTAYLQRLQGRPLAEILDEMGVPER